MRGALLAVVLLLVSLQAAYAAEAEPPKLEIIAALDQRPANIALSVNNRIFVTMHPFDKPKYKVMELVGGKLVPYPSPEWSMARGKSKNPDKELRDLIGIEDAIGIRCMVRNVLYVLDMGSKKYEPRLLGFTAVDGKLFVNSPIPKEVLTEQSFLQDFAFDWTDNATYIADMGQADLTKPAKPAIIVVYSNPFQTPRRLLEGHPSLMPTEKPMQAEGKDVLVMKGDKPTQIHAGLNPITMDPQRDWLYYGPMGSGKIYRISLSKMKDINYPPEQLAASVEEVADKPESDGMTVDAAGNIYLTNVNAGEIGIIRPGQKYETYLKDERLTWADGFSFGADGMLYITINQLNRSKPLNLGKEEGKKPYLIARFKPVMMGTLGR